MDTANTFGNAPRYSSLSKVELCHALEREYEWISTEIELLSQSLRHNLRQFNDMSPKQKLDEPRHVGQMTSDDKGWTETEQSDPVDCLSGKTDENHDSKGQQASFSFESDQAFGQGIGEGNTTGLSTPVAEVPIDGTLKEPEVVKQSSHNKSIVWMTDREEKNKELQLKRPKGDTHSPTVSSRPLCREETVGTLPKAF